MCHSISCVWPCRCLKPWQNCDDSLASPNCLSRSSLCLALRLYGTMCCVDHPAGFRCRVLANIGTLHIVTEVGFGLLSALVLSGVGVLASVLCVIGASLVTFKCCGKDYSMAVHTCGCLYAGYGTEVALTPTGCATDLLMTCIGVALVAVNLVVVFQLSFALRTTKAVDGLHVFINICVCVARLIAAFFCAFARGEATAATAAALHGVTHVVPGGTAASGGASVEVGVRSPPTHGAGARGVVVARPAGDGGAVTAAGVGLGLGKLKSAYNPTLGHEVPPGHASTQHQPAASRMYPMYPAQPVVGQTAGGN